MSRTVVFVWLAYLLLPQAFGDQPKPATELLSDGMAKAKNQNKRVFLLFGSPG
jgi:hypothetical protein